MDILTQNGLPVDFKSEDAIQNEQTGSLTVANLQPDVCLLLIENMNRKRFLNRQVYITSVVADSPANPALQLQLETLALKAFGKNG